MQNYLRDDGVFLLRSVGNNSSEIILMDLIKVLWATFRKQNQKDAVDGNGNAARAITSEPHEDKF